MYCNQCGNKLSPDDRYCSRCGKSVSRQKLAAKQKTAPAAAQKKMFKPELFKTFIKNIFSKIKNLFATLINKFKNKKAKIILASFCGAIIITAIAVPSVYFTSNSSSQWQYDKRISEPITAVSFDKDITLGEIETHGVSLYIPSQTFDSQTTVTLSHPEDNPPVDRSAFTPAGALVRIESSARQNRLKKPAKMTMSIDNLRRDRQGTIYVAALNEKNEWDYILPDEVDFENRRVTFKTHHLGTYGLVNIKDEKLVDLFISRQSVRQWAQLNLETDAGWMRDELVKEILQDKLKITDEANLDKMIEIIAETATSKELVSFITSKDAEKFINSITDATAAHIPEVVDPMILKNALEDVAAQPWASGFSESILQSLQAGNTGKAVSYVLDSIASQYINEWKDLILYVFIFYDISYWENQEIEKAYQVYRNGTEKNSPIWGYEAKAGDFDILWTQLGGVVEEMYFNKLISVFDANLQDISETDEEEMSDFNEELKQKIKKDFDARLARENEIIKFNDNNKNMVSLLENKGLLKMRSSNPSYMENDNLESLIKRSYDTIEKIKRDTGRYEIIYRQDKAETEDNYPDDMIYATDLVDLIHIFYKNGEEAYFSAIKDMGLNSVEDKTLTIDTGTDKLLLPADTGTIGEMIAEETPTQETIMGGTTIEEPIKSETAQSDTAVNEQINNADLQGLWMDDYGTVIKISGNKGTYVKFASTFNEFVDTGILKRGDVSIKDITKIVEDSEKERWTCSFMVFFNLDINDPDAIGWSDKATLLLSSEKDFFLLSVTATDPKTGEVYSGRIYIFNRFESELDIEYTPGGSAVPVESSLD